VLSNQEKGGVNASTAIQWNVGSPDGSRIEEIHGGKWRAVFGGGGGNPGKSLAFGSSMLEFEHEFFFVRDPG